MVTAKPTDKKFQELGYPKQPTSYKEIMQSINHHYREHHNLHKKLQQCKNENSKKYHRIVALKKQLTLVTKERYEIMKKFEIVWDKGEFKGEQEGGKNK